MCSPIWVKCPTCGGVRDKQQAIDEAVAAVLDRIARLPRECSDTMPQGVVRGWELDRVIAAIRRSRHEGSSPTPAAHGGESDG